VTGKDRPIYKVRPIFIDRYYLLCIW